MKPENVNLTSYRKLSQGGDLLTEVIVLVGGWWVVGGSDDSSDCSVGVDSGHYGGVAQGDKFGNECNDTSRILSVRDGIKNELYPSLKKWWIRERSTTKFLLMFKQGVSEGLSTDLW